MRSKKKIQLTRWSTHINMEWNEKSKKKQKTKEKHKKNTKKNERSDDNNKFIKKNHKI